MAAGSAVAAAGSGGSAAPAGAGGNPFQVVTNLYAEKNIQGIVPGQLLGASTVPIGGAINAGNYLRALRLVIRTTVAGVAGTVGADGVFNAIQQIVLTNVDGSEILYNMSGYAHSLAHKYFRVFEQDPYGAYDYAVGLSPSGTLVLKPEIRWTAGVLANTDSRSQYRFDGAINTLAAFQATTYTTAPTLSITPFMDAWAQPDDTDLQGQPNQPVPPGVNLQVKRRHSIQTGMSAAGGNNIIQNNNTGNALRGQLLIFRDGNGARQDGLSDPISYTIDNRRMGKYSPDIIFQWMQDFYNSLARSTRETGVYVYPTFLKPGDLEGQGWLYTSNATRILFESATAAGIVGSPSLEIVTDEVYPVGPVDPVLVDI